jgi:hypothetical protein
MNIILGQTLEASRPPRPASSVRLLADYAHAAGVCLHRERAVFLDPLTRGLLCLLGANWSVGRCF